jgi:hypothetical protein
MVSGVRALLATSAAESLAKVSSRRTTADYRLRPVLADLSG